MQQVWIPLPLFLRKSELLLGIDVMDRIYHLASNISEVCEVLTAYHMTLCKCNIIIIYEYQGTTITNIILMWPVAETDP